MDLLDADLGFAEGSVSNLFIHLWMFSLRPGKKDEWFTSICKYRIKKAELFDFHIWVFGPVVFLPVLGPN